MSEPATYVFVPGGFSSGADFAVIAEQLRRKGRRVFALTLTGLGERVHLLSPQTGLETHIRDVTNTLLFNGLDDVILVGHSYGGMVITGAADRMPERISTLVYLDALVPRHGESALQAAAAGASVPPPVMTGDVMPLTNEVAALLGIPASLRWRYTPQPMKTMTDPIFLTGAYKGVRKRVYLRARRFPGMAATYARIRNERGWRLEEIDAGHNVMNEAPQQIVKLLETI